MELKEESNLFTAKFEFETRQKRAKSPLKPLNKETEKPNCLDNYQSN